MKVEDILASRTKNMQASEIREILKLTTKPGMISLGGGMPAPESFPISIIGELTELVVKKYGAGAFQYGPTEGFPALRAALVPYLNSKGIKCETDDIIISTGSQGLLDSFGKVFISDGDPVCVESPTYLGAIQAFNAYGPKYILLDTDDKGLIPESLEEVLSKQQVKFVYLVPTFQNPTGRTITRERRLKIAELVKRYDTLLVEDDPYSDLRYRGEPVPSLKSLAPEHVVYTSTFSKTFAPGFRLGFTVAPEPVKKWLVVAKQGIDLHTSTFNQALAAEYMTGGYFDRQLVKTIAMYKSKQQAMLNAMDKYFPDCFKWTRPEGGMFIWAEGPENVDTYKMYHKAVDCNIAFVPGKCFYPYPEQGNVSMRLNYTNATEEELDIAIKRLAEVIKEECD
ncbi:PLP-dependent aminotransferase family protein [bacterium]|nr:PLP-dependent aminotransferase family protein [bacterium]